MTDSRTDDPTAHVRRALTALGHAGGLLVISGSTHTAEEAAAAAGCALGQIVKTLAVYVADAPMLVLVAGDRRLDDRLLSARFGVGRKQVKFASAAQVLELTGYAVGGVCPFGLPAPLDVLVDESLRRFETVWSAGGTPNAIFPITLADLVGFTAGVFAEITT